MFELLALLVAVIVGGIIVCGTLFLALTVVKFTVKLALLPLKILFFPIVAILFVVKFAVVFALGAALVAVFIAVIIPIVILVALVGIPMLIIGVVT